MPWFEGTHTETRTLPVPPERALAHFADPSTIFGNTKNLETSEVDGDVLHFVMKEENHGVVKFKADFRCRYVVEGDRLTWQTLDGNLRQSGEARFTPEGDGTTLTYTETVRVDLGVPEMMAPMLQPMVGPMLASEVKAYVKRVAASL